MDGQKEFDDYIKSIGPISLEEEEKLELVEKAKAGDKDAEWKIIRAHILLVAKIAISYSNQAISDLKDLAQGGVIGLLKGIPKFDPVLSNGRKFSSYIVDWIKAYALPEAIKQSQVINMKSLPRILSDYFKVYYYLFQKNGEKPDISEISERMHVSIERIEKMFGKFKETQCISLNGPIRDKLDPYNTTTIEEHLADPKEFDLITEIWKKEITTIIPDILSRISPRDKAFLERRFFEKLTLEEMKEEFGMTKEGIRQNIIRAKKEFKKILRRYRIEL